MFIEKIKESLRELNLEPRTLGDSDYDYDAPLRAIRRLMLESNGLLTVAFKRTLNREVEYKASGDLGVASEKITNRWLTSLYCQIEPAMAFQIGLSVLVLREKGVIEDGILEKGVLGMYMPEFDLSNTYDSYFNTEEWQQLVKKWEVMVRKVYEKKGEPPQLF